MKLFSHLVDLQAYLEKQEPYEALDMCNDMQQFFADKGRPASRETVS